jgi:carbohydrate-selective porin OprB
MKRIEFLIIMFAVMSVGKAAVIDSTLTLSLKLTNEGHWNMSNGKGNYLNQLEAGLEVGLWKNGTLQADLLSAYNQRIANNDGISVAEDHQVFSNILLDEQLPLSLFQFGIEQKVTDNFSLYVGVRNMNIDYFCTPYTAFFTNSSNGIYPTIADNFSVGNYPAASMCLHIDWEIAKNVMLKNSFYNGRASTKWDEVFRFRPNADGIINVTEISYDGSDEEGKLLGKYHAGFLYSNTPSGGETEKRANCSIFGLIEQPLLKGSKEIGLLLQGGYSPKKKNDTYGYFGAGIVADNLLREGDGAGLNVNRVLCNGGEHETDVELTYNIPIVNHLNLQPALHFIRTSGESNTVGMLRAVVSF